MKKPVYLSKATLCLFMALIPIKIFAQPNVQNQGLRAPAAIKIDGKTNEWGDKFEAYNHATDLGYSIANDDDNLYLAFRSTDPDALTKLMASGINFIIKPQKKDSTYPVSILFPYYPNYDQPYINFTKIPKTIASSTASLAMADSLMKTYNAILDAKSKYIKVNGISGVDSIISVYNNIGIKAKGAFDINIAYTCELAFPLKYLSFISNDIISFEYQIVLKGTTPRSLGIIAVRDAYGRIMSASGPAAGVPSKAHGLAINSTTDFKGKYTLIKSDKK